MTRMLVWLKCVITQEGKKKACQASIGGSHMQLFAMQVRLIFSFDLFLVYYAFLAEYMFEWI